MRSCTLPPGIIRVFSRLKTVCGTLRPYREEYMILTVMITTQDMLHRSAAVHLRLRRSRRGIRKAPVCRRARDGVGYLGGRNHGEYRGSLCVFSLVFREKRLFCLIAPFRRVHQRLLPKTPGRDQRAVESYACAWRFQRRVFPSPMGDETRGVANFRLRGSVSRPIDHL